MPSQYNNNLCKPQISVWHYLTVRIAEVSFKKKIHDFTI